MAYLSEDKITGKVVLNMHAIENGRIVNFRSTEDRMVKSSIFRNFKSDPSIIKFNKYSIRQSKSEIVFYKNELRKYFGRNNDFTFSTWMYGVNQPNLFQCPFWLDGNGIETYVPFSYYRESNNGANWDYGKNSLVILIQNNPNPAIFSDISQKAMFDQWIHYAVTKKGDTEYFFRNGIMLKSYKFDSSQLTTWFGGSGDIGLYTSTDVYNNGTRTPSGTQYIDDYVFIADQCLWTTDFAVPTEPLIGDIGYKKILYPPNLNKDNSMKFLP